MLRFVLITSATLESASAPSITDASSTSSKASSITLTSSSSTPGPGLSAEDAVLASGCPGASASAVHVLQHRSVLEHVGEDHEADPRALSLLGTFFS